MRRRVEVGEFSEAEAIAELRARASRGSRRRTSAKPAEERTQLPVPSRREPERVWEFASFEDLAEAMRPMLPAGLRRRPRRRSRRRELGRAKRPPPARVPLRVEGGSKWGAEERAVMVLQSREGSVSTRRAAAAPLRP
jgi:hypothetical protein